MERIEIGGGFRNDFGIGKLEKGKKVFYKEGSSTRYTKGLVDTRVKDYANRKRIAINKVDGQGIATNAKALILWKEVQKWMEE